MASAQSACGSASVHGALWGARGRDWAEVQERFSRPLHEAVFAKTRVGVGTAVLDIGCGAGLFCAMASERGARVCGLDASDALVAIARRRVPLAAFQVGEMETLPHADRTFDVVTGLNAFQFGVRPVAALAEARRVARPHARVVVATWGKPERVEAAQYLAAVCSLLPPAPPRAPGPFALSADGALEAFAKDAGLTPRSVDEVECPFEYPDLDTALRGLLSEGPAIRAMQESGEDRVRRAVEPALAPYRLMSGGYRLENSVLVMVATA
ncbi:MAG TPA: class I SAM-dependent methyltransferase [bacterium]|nr:class I SAM-dependent methyltransferase [bacterium]